MVPELREPIRPSAPEGMGRAVDPERSWIDTQVHQSGLQVRESLLLF